MQYGRLAIKRLLKIIQREDLKVRKHGYIFGFSLWLVFLDIMPILVTTAIFLSIYISLNIFAIEFWQTHPIIFSIYTLWCIISLNYYTIIQADRHLSARIFQNIYYVHSKAANNFSADLGTFDLFCLALVNVVLFAGVYNVAGIVDDGVIVTGNFLDSLYFSLVTWTTLGYGDFQPPSNIRLIASLEALMGYVYMAFIIGFIFSQSSKSQLLEADRREVLLFDVEDIESIVIANYKTIEVDFIDRDKKYVCFKVNYEFSSEKSAFFVESTKLNDWFAEGGIENVQEEIRSWAN